MKLLVLRAPLKTYDFICAAYKQVAARRYTPLILVVLVSVTTTAMLACRLRPMGLYDNSQDVVDIARRATSPPLQHRLA